MSQENVDIVRRATELWNDENWEGLGAVFDPHVVVLPPEGWPDGEVLTGLNAWIEQSRRLKEPWSTDQMISDQGRVVGDSVVIRLRWKTTGSGSGVGVATEFWGVYTLLDRKIIRMAFYFDRSRALEAVGLKE